MTSFGRAYVIAQLDKAASKGEAELRDLWENCLGDEYKRDKAIQEHKDKLKQSMEAA